MGRSQVEYNRKHGRGRVGGRGRGRGGGRQPTATPPGNRSNSRRRDRRSPSPMNQQKEEDESSQPTKANRPSYLAPTSSSAGKTKAPLPTQQQQQQPRRRPSVSSSSSSQQHQATPNRQRGIGSDDDDAHGNLHSSTTATTVTPAATAAALHRPEDPPVLDDAGQSVVVPLEPPPSTDAPYADEGNHPNRRPSRSHRHHHYENKVDDDDDDEEEEPLPDSPPQRGRPAKAADYSHLLLYRSAAGAAAVPKPEPSMVLSALNLDPAVLSRALRRSLPWHQRWRLSPTAVALAVDWEEGDDDEESHYDDNDDRTAPNATTTSRSPPLTKMGVADGSNPPNNSSGSAATTTDHRSFSSRMLEKARQKYPHGFSHRSSSQASRAASAGGGGGNEPNKGEVHTSPYTALDVPATLTTQPPDTTTTTTNNPLLATAVSTDGQVSAVTLPTALGPTSSTLTQVPSRGDETTDSQLASWLDSTLQSFSRETDEQDGEPQPDDRGAPPQSSHKEDGAHAAKEIHYYMTTTETGVPTATTNLVGGEMDDADEDNMEDWLDQQIM